ncbi:hypothetical protein PIB30_055493 [Stylosanthes scabra]|uniref:Uncharacterized protein n=1 Tax=Stylosanthes scabra TaxID=79078 RepID=A0ABU6UI45_9FABA|nr:hypothetical protein [Stylosanthes scabra]
MNAYRKLPKKKQCGLYRAAANSHKTNDGMNQHRGPSLSITPTTDSHEELYRHCSSPKSDITMNFSHQKPAQNIQNATNKQGNYRCICHRNNTITKTPTPTIPQ